MLFVKIVKTDCLNFNPGTMTMVIKFVALSSEKSHWLAVLLGPEPHENNHDLDPKSHSTHEKI